jgi:Zn-dependent protease with chaperone function
VIEARYFPANGAAKAVSARVSMSDTEQALLIHLDDGFEPMRVKVAEINLSERFSRAVRSIYLPDGAMLEVDDGAAVSQMLGATAKRDSWITRWQHSWRTVAFSFATSVALGALGYLFGLPVLADYLSHRVPTSWTAKLDEAVLSQFKRMSGFQDSKIPEADQARLRARFEAIVASAATQQFTNARGTVPQTKVYFYSAGNVPNAFALPGGTIVFFDGLIKLAPDDDAIVGVFAHEYGHVIHRHGLRNLLRSAVVSAVAAWYFGDFTTLANAAILTSQLSYSREFEREADDAALQIMRANGLNTKSLAALFKKMRDHDDHDHGDIAKENDPTKAKEAAKEGGGAKKNERSRFSVPEFLSTHPDIDSRIERFENEATK